VVIDLSSVRTFDDFVRAMKSAFPLDEDPLEIWRAIQEGLLWQRSPLRLRFTGWSRFESVMPRFAAKLKRMLRSHIGRVTVEYRDADET
jgi:hypothetical protein